MKYLVKTYNPINTNLFDTIKEAQDFIYYYAYLNDISLGTLSIDKATISLQISDKQKPQIRFERNSIQFN
jgi:hypothetical protein